MNEKRKNTSEIYERFSSAASSGDCTGLIPSGDNLDADKVANYKDILPFNLPGAIKEYDHEELARISRLNDTP